LFGLCGLLIEKEGNKAVYCLIGGLIQQVYAFFVIAITIEFGEL
jgi:hypothetical protein